MSEAWSRGQGQGPGSASASPRARIDGPSHVAAVILAAGSSTRMGENKLLLSLGGQSLVSHALRAASGAGLDPVVVVLGHEADRVRMEIAGVGLPFTAVVNPDHAAGKGSSLQAGIAHVLAATPAEAAVVMLADMPFVTTGMLSALVARHRQSGAPMVVSRYGAVDAPPMLYARDLFAELLALPGEACGKEMIRRHGREAHVLVWPEHALDDIDAPDDYERVLARLARGDS